MNTATAITIAALAALTPTVTCLIGIILSRQDVRDLRSEMNILRIDLERFRAEIRAGMDSSALKYALTWIAFALRSGQTCSPCARTSTPTYS